jgi:hypothetical protein
MKTRQTCTLAAAAIAVLNLSRTSSVNSASEIGNPTTRRTKTLSASGVGLGVGVVRVAVELGVGVAATKSVDVSKGAGGAPSITIVPFIAASRAAAAKISVVLSVGRLGGASGSGEGASTLIGAVRLRFVPVNRAAGSAFMASTMLESCVAADGGLTAAGAENTEKRLHPAAVHALTLADI